MKKFHYSTNQQGFTFQEILVLIAIVLLLITAGVYHRTILETAGFKLVKITPPPSPTPTPTPKKLSPEEVKQYIAEAAALREAGNYEEGERKNFEAYNRALELKDPALAVEAGNNLSIQYRLTAGRLNRQGRSEEALKYSERSLEIFELLQQRGWFSQKDPINMRSYAHALLYAGNIKEVLPVLEQSYQLQTDPAAKGDELSHKAAALYAQGRNEEARATVDEGIRLIQNNNGSPVWLTFAYMTKASILAKLGSVEDSKIVLQEAAGIAQQNNLAVRKEEIEYLSRQDAAKVDVLSAVGTPAKK